MEDKNNWKRLLFYMHNNQQNWSYFTKKIKYKENNQIEKDLKLTHHEFQSSFSFLEDLELIELRNDTWYISKKGLEIILKLQEHDDNNSNNKIIQYLTLILALGVIYQIAEGLTYLMSEEIKGTVRITTSIVILITIILFSKAKEITF